MTLSRGNAPALPYAEVLYLSREHDARAIQLNLLFWYDYPWSIKNINDALNRGRQKVGAPPFHSYIMVECQGLSGKEAARKMHEKFGYWFNPKNICRNARLYKRRMGL